MRGPHVHHDSGVDRTMPPSYRGGLRFGLFRFRNRIKVASDHADISSEELSAQTLVDRGARIGKIGFCARVRS